MNNFSSEHGKIQTQLPNNLRALLDTHIGTDDRASGKADTVQLSRDFVNYGKHVSTGVPTNRIHEPLAAAIGKIEGVGLAALNKHIGDKSTNNIDNGTFTGPFGKIEKELKHIAELVGETRQSFVGGLGPNKNSLKEFVKQLQDGLGANQLGGVKGLDAIKQGIAELQTGKFGPSSEQIAKAVEAIRNEVEELKKKLKADRDSKDDVINRLEHLKAAGLGGETNWQPNGKDPKISGIGKIKNDMEEQNNKLSKLTNEIEQATHLIMNQIQIVLKGVQMKLQDKVTTDDVLDQLEALGNKIGKNGSNDSDNLLVIYNVIKKLHEIAFTKQPQAIEKAQGAIEQELTTIQLQLLGFDGKTDGVINTLRDMKDVGLSEEDWQKHGNKKGLQKIENELNTLLKLLSQQPKQIESGVEQITKELQELREELQGNDSGKPHQKGVITNLKDMITMIGKDKNEGLDKIKTDIDDLKNSQLRQVTDKLVTLFGYIQNAAAYAGWHVSQMQTSHIDVKLKGIAADLTNLRLKDLAAAIRLCDDVLIKADEIERNTIAALLKYVDDEVDDAINDLTKHARQHYVDSVREALLLFVKKVTEDLQQLPNEINHDLTIGFKGFMNAVEGDKSVNINKLKCVESRELKLLSAAYAGFFSAINVYVRKEITRLHDEQNKERNPSLPPTDEPYTPKLNDVYEALTALLFYLRDNDGGADKLTELVERLANALSKLVPSDFKHPSTPLLDTVSRGLSKFAGDFSNTYISTYSGQRCREEHAHKYAKVLLSMIPMTHKALSKLMMKCEGEWKHLHICEFTADDRDNALGNYLTRCGYRVSGNYAVQDGELNNMFTGGGIYELLTTRIEDVGIEMMIDRVPVKNGIDLINIISLLYNTLCQYFQACHIPVPPNPRYPCTVRDMLSWLSGLRYTLVADKLSGHCKALLNRRCHDGDTPNRDDPIMAKCIESLPSTIATTCSRSTALLTAIQGNGHGFDLAAYPYSVDFSNNRAKLHYPADPAELLDMLRKIAYRLCKVLYFLYSQCCRSTARVKGWRECAYGRQVQSHHWQCNTFGTDATTARTTATTAATTTTFYTSIHGCPPTSPLQSFLADCCGGLLPHTLTAADGTIECANCLANQPGQQCLTPLGFWDLGFAASINGTGWDLAKHLGDMCRDADSCLFVLCRILSYLCPAAPSSLADVFALYAQVLRQWDPHERVEHRGGTYTDASDFISHLNTDGIDSLFPLWKQLHGSYENGKLTTAIASLAGHDHKSHDALSSLFNDSTCKPPSGCAPYLQPLGLHANHTYPKKHAGLYITWIMHLAWQFWELLTHLLHALDNIDCTASGCATCPCQPGIHGDKDTCHCPSIVQCAGPLPTLYRYGFTYRNANLLVTDNYAIRCGDLNTQLKEALHSAHFTELFRQIDQLIWHIRMPFVYFLIALWSLVALYILHTFLYRLDIFHIRSHLLTTKASHLIDVKALLIPSRKMLSLYNASYFDDDPSELLDAT